MIAKIAKMFIPKPSRLAKMAAGKVQEMANGMPEAACMTYLLRSGRN